MPSPPAPLPDDRLASLRDLIARSREGEPAVQAYFAETMRELGCDVEIVRYDPSSVPMIEEFAGARDRCGQAAERGGSSARSSFWGGLGSKPHFLRTPGQRTDRRPGRLEPSAFRRSDRGQPPLWLGRGG